VRAARRMACAESSSAGARRQERLGVPRDGTVERYGAAGPSTVQQGRTAAVPAVRERTPVEPGVHQFEAEDRAAVLARTLVIGRCPPTHSPSVTGAP
jgi:hypothetical protein